MHSIFEFEKLIQYSDIKKNSFCTDNDTKKLRNVLLKGFYKTSITFTSKQGRQTSKINKWGGEGGRGWS